MSPLFFIGASPSMAALRECCFRQHEDTELRGWMEQFGRLGLDSRLVPELPLKMQSFDEEVVIVSMEDPTGGPPGFTAVVIHNQGVTAMLNLAFESTCGRAAKPFMGSKPEEERMGEDETMHWPR